MKQEKLALAARQLAEWRERGEDSLAPSRFLFMEALARRMAGQDGDAWRVLEERLLRYLRHYQDEIVEPARQSAQCSQQAAAHGGREAASGPLGELLRDRTRLQMEGSGGGTTTDASAMQPLSLDPALIDYFRNAWASVSASRMVRQSGEQVPDNAGPLNSSGLAHRTLTLMQTLSPGYLQHFLSYMDALSWIEQLNEDRLKAEAKPAASGKRKAAPRKA
ncbi:DUF2894 domain-containing protein [Pusillimonas sp. MFBS29]|uniref:DUF2894 domain-containing protein n=1 Tax=Pusillimonas sp. MFBS29 TaxID=2886690 RepID=UPI001D12EB6B|nr:DUF2894 domain-containing protein [Pusillimonas sp. MFBS29]MCC2597645.1 DUF2894 domain-containing protein [Pusillimonas sp. MFBS29]